MTSDSKAVCGGGEAKTFYLDVFTVAAETIRKGAPGLSQPTAEAIARSIALKVRALPAARVLKNSTEA